MLEECFRRESGLGLRGMMCSVVLPDSVLMEIPSISVSRLGSRPLKDFGILRSETAKLQGLGEGLLAGQPHWRQPGPVCSPSKAITVLQPLATLRLLVPNPHRVLVG